jgi:hypothetical protein
VTPGPESVASTAVGSAKVPDLPADLPPAAVEKVKHLDTVTTESRDLVLLRVDTPEDADVVVDQGVAQAVGDAANAVVIVVVGNTRLESLPDEEMAKYGWVRSAPARADADDLLRVVAPST